MKQMQIIKNFWSPFGLFYSRCSAGSTAFTEWTFNPPQQCLSSFSNIFSLFVLPKWSTIFFPFGHNTRNIPFSHPGVKHEISCLITSSVEANDLFSGKGFENVMIISLFFGALNAVSKVVTGCLRMTTVWQPHR